MVMKGEMVSYMYDKSGTIVYFLTAEGLDAVKIGSTDDLRSRQKQLQIGCPVALALLSAVVGGRDVELALHERFKSHRIRGEWFRLSAIRDEILALPPVMTATKSVTRDDSQPPSKRWRRRYAAA